MRSTRLPISLAVLVIVALIAMVAGAVGTYQALRPLHGSVATDMAGRRVSLDPGEAPVTAAKSHAVASKGSRLVVSSVGLDVPLGALNTVHGQITPPGFTSAYRVRNMGVPASDARAGTVFVVMHSLRNGGKAPGNFLTDVRTGTATVAHGARVVVDGVRYTVTDWGLVKKSAIADNATVWANDPGRLLLITCLEKPDGTASTENMVISATAS